MGNSTGWCCVELHRLLTFVPSVFVPHPYVLQVFGTLIALCVSVVGVGIASSILEV